ncbi:Reducing polyketide synthase FUB1 [Mycena sanguinolenta]|uniref:Reducing polyketide synthase FUB1 n=1 Tax=Mycena sanguinolenta TaxID=230812 RepID=A0A8H6ZCA8_9AGAR|nr:Reducing polyketide synthase FUB1 [Mycena sanguinolenta]
MRHRTPELDTCVLKPVAIVGISAELPSGDYAEENLDHETFFRFLLEGGQAYQKIPMERFNAEAWKGHGLGKVITDRGAFLKNISLFDHVEFGISAKDARSMSVSTRKLIELSFLALLDSGIHYRGQRVGCYTSGIPFDILTVADPDEYEARGSFAGGPCMIANKISYHLDLLGRFWLCGSSIPTDTACSSSLTALHLAVQALRSGDCEAAVIGGCQLNHRFIDFIQYSQGGVLSPDGTCKPFDASANGFSRGEGAVVIVVKLLEDAIRDGDRIYASILGTSITANGSAAPANAPVGDAQAEAMRQAYKGTGRSPKEVDFIELHATGTAAGDPVEANWTGREFKRDGEIMIGSVKGNIGHLEISAFLASLSKICSMFSYGIIPPNVNMIKPNPAIEWDRYRLRVPLEPTPLAPRHPSGAALVSMMSSGIGGVNGHAVIEGPPAQPVSSELYDPREGTTVPVLLVAGGLSPRSASSISATLEEELLNAPGIDLPLLSTIYGRRARQMTWRSFAIVLPDRSITVPFVPPVLNQRTKRPIAFVFSGQGPQHFHMGRQLFQALPLFKDCIMRLDGIYRRRTGSSLIEMTGLFTNHSSRAEQLPIIWPISITLPALTMVQIALCDVLRDIGIVPDIVIGHSAGETALLYACGAAPAEMVMELAIARGQAMALADEGSMAAVSCTAGEAENIVQTVNAELCGILQVACYNATDSFTLVGHNHLIERAIDVAETRGFFARKLRTRVGVHSSLMDSCRDVYVKLVSEVFSRFPTASGYTPQIPVFSGLTGDLYDQAFTPDYFWHQTRLPVRFEEALSSLLRHSPLAMFLEIGPHPVLSAYISHAAADSPVLCPMRRFKVLSVHDEMQTYLKFVGQLVVLGSTAVDFRRLNELKDILYGILPIKPYPFQRKDIPYYPETSAIVKRQMASRNGPLNSPFLHISAQTHPSLSQHIIQGEPIMPAAGFLEMAFEFGAWSLWNVSFRSMLSLPSEKVTVIDVAKEGLYWSVKSRSVGSNPQNARLHADGYMSLERNLEPTPALNIPDIKARSSPFSMTRFYSALSYFAQYGPQFQRVEATWKGENEALVQVRGVAEDLPDACEYIIHPAILDACLHVMVHPAFTGNADRNTYYLPSRVQWVVRHAGAWKPDGLVLDLIVADSSGNYLCSMSGFEVAAHQVASDWTSDKQRFELINQPYSISPFLRNASSTPSPSVFHKFYQMYHHVKERVGKRVIRVLDLGSDEALTTELHAVTTQDSATYCDYIVARKQTANPVIYPAGVNVIELDTDQRDNNPTLNPMTFDIVLGSQLSPIDWPDATMAIELASRLLLPGGAFILQHPDFVNHTAIRVSDAFDSTAHCQDSTIPILFSQSRPLSISDILPANVTPPASVIFELGRELEIQRRLKEMDDAQPLWIESIFDDHGAAAQGFTRSLRKELARPVHLVLFAQCWNASERLNMMRQLTQVAHLEQEIIIDSRRVILVPRLCPSIPPPLHHLNDTDYWIKTDAGSVSLLPLPTVPDDNILIRITATFPISQGLSVVAGDVALARSESWTIFDALPTFVRIHHPTLASMAPIGDIHDPQSLLDPLSSVNCRRLFDPSGVYLLVGGIGSLGMHIALWMYTVGKGARNLVLTSRSGRQSLIRQKNVIALRILSYLETLEDLSLTLISCDASSPPQTAECISQIESPIRGVMMLSVQLSDGIFSKHSKATYEVPFTAKRGALLSLATCLALEDLDFLISMSSAAIFGNAGQTNYASANSTLDEMLREYKNAFSIIAPAIIDSSTIARTEDLLADSRLAQWAPWAMSSKGKAPRYVPHKPILMRYVDICNCIEDGLNILRDRPFSLYVPDYDWYNMQKHFGASPIYDHLVPYKIDTSGAVDSSSVESLQQLVLRFIDADPQDFETSIPLTSYGLDSLSAGRLSRALKPFVALTQLQLLADMSLDDVLVRMDHQSAESEVPDGGDLGHRDR